MRAHQEYVHETHATS